jgi:hypothetical protein
VRGHKADKHPSPEQLAAFRKDLDQALHHIQRNACLELRSSRISTRGDGNRATASASKSASHCLRAQ